MRPEGNAPALLLMVGLALALFLGLITAHPPASTALGTLDAATPTPDRLATPVMPESPTQVDIGRNLYYYHCMPCHGDRGQGLTDEWRQAWVEDHQDCWARGCHSGRAGDEAFPLPRSVPAVSGSSQLIANLTADDLFDYLLHNHPPQRPGALSEDECWALTAFVLHENGRLSPDGHVGPGVAKRSRSGIGILIAVILGLLLITGFVYRRGRKKSRI